MYMCVYIYIYVYTCIYIYTYVCVCVCAEVYRQQYIYNSYINAYAKVLALICHVVDIRRFIHTCIHTCLNTLAQVLAVIRHIVDEAAPMRTNLEKAAAPHKLQHSTTLSGADSKSTELNEADFSSMKFLSGRGGAKMAQREARELPPALYRHFSG